MKIGRNHRRSSSKAFLLFLVGMLLNFSVCLPIFCPSRSEGHSHEKNHSDFHSKDSEHSHPSTPHSHDHFTSGDTEESPSPSKEESPFCCDNIQKDFLLSSNLKFQKFEFKSSLLFTSVFILPHHFFLVLEDSHYTHYGTSPPRAFNLIPLYTQQSRLLI